MEQLFVSRITKLSVSGVIPDLILEMADPLPESAELCAPLSCPLPGSLCALRAPAPPTASSELSWAARLPSRAQPTLPLPHARKERARRLPDSEVDYAQAEKEVAQAAPRFPGHSPRWWRVPRAGLC